MLLSEVQTSQEFPRTCVDCQTEGLLVGGENDLSLPAGREEPSSHHQRLVRSRVAGRAPHLGPGQLRGDQQAEDPLRQDLAAGHSVVQQVEFWTGGGRTNLWNVFQCRRLLQGIIPKLSNSRLQRKCVLGTSHQVQVDMSSECDVLPFRRPDLSSEAELLDVRRIQGV